MGWLNPPVCSACEISDCATHAVMSASTEAYPAIKRHGESKVMTPY